MVEMTVIEPAKTEWATSIGFAPKKVGSQIFRVDYEKFNTVTKLDSTP